MVISSNDHIFAMLFKTTTTDPLVYHRAQKKALSNDTNFFFGFCYKVKIAETSLNEICRNNQSNNEMFGFEMSKCVLKKKLNVW